MAAINRRDFFKGLGAGVVLLNPMVRMLAHSATSPNQAKYFIFMFSPNGTVLDNWRPSGTTTAGTLDLSNSSILAPLQSYKNKITCLQGVHNIIKGPGDDHVRGVLAALSAVQNNEGMAYGGKDNIPATGYNSGQSIDQKIASQFGYKESLVVAAQASGFFSLISTKGSNDPVTPIENPVNLHGQLFGNINPALTDDEAKKTLRKSVLDFAIEDMKRLKTRLPTQLNSRLEDHADALRTLELAISAPPSPTPLPDGCQVPTVGKIENYDEGIEYPAAITMQMRNIVYALACGKNNSAVLLCGTGVDMHTHTWVSVPQNHHSISHEKSSSALTSLTTINNWYAKRFKELLDLLSAVPMSGGNMLDQSIVVWGNELSDGATHSRDNIPYVIAGGAGGRLAGGRFLDYRSWNQNKGYNHGELLVSIANVMGVPINTWGTGTRPLTGLIS